MTTNYTWLGSSAPWTSSSAWSINGVPTTASPGPSDVALVSAPGTYSIAVDNTQVGLVNVTDPNASIVVKTLFSAPVLFNAGTISVRSGATLNEGGGGLSNTGLITLAGASVFAAFGAYTTAALGNIQNAGGTLNLNGTLDNTQGTLAASTYGTMQLLGTINGGTVVNDGAGGIVNNNPLLNAVTFKGPLVANTLRVAGGFAVQSLSGGAGTATLLTLNPLDSETLDNLTLQGTINNTINIGVAAGTTLTLGSHGTIIAPVTPFYYYASSISGGSFTTTGSIAGRGNLSITTTSLINAGTISNYTGASLNLAQSSTTLVTNYGLIANNGGTLNVSSSTVSFNNPGTIVASGGTSYIRPSVIGTGGMALANHGRLELASTYDAQKFLFLDGSSDLLVLDFAFGTNTVNGFGVGDTIELAKTPATLTFSNGTLTASQGGSPVASFVMTGVPQNASFTGSIDSGNNTFITVVGVPPAPHSYTWIPGFGLWQAAPSWADITSGFTPGFTVPGSLDTVSIAGSGFPGFTLLGGPGRAASITVGGGNVALQGGYVVGSLNGADTLDVVATGTVAAGNISTGALAANNLEVTGTGAAVNVAGLLTVADSVTTGRLTLGNRASLQAGSLLLSNQTVAVDSTATAEIGTAAGVAGSLKIDSSAMLQGPVSIAAPLIVNGTVSLVAGPSTLAAVSGTGTLAIGAGALLLQGVVTAGVQVLFNHAGSLLSGAAETLTLPGSASFAGTITGFSITDVINLPMAGITAAAYSGSAAAGTLTLSGTSGALATLALTGDFTGETFLAVPQGGTSLASSQIVLAPGAFTLLSSPFAGTTANFSGNQVLAASYSATQATVGNNTPGSSILALQPGATLNAGTLTDLLAPIAVGGAGALLAVSGTMTDNSVLTLYNRGVGQAGALLLNGGTVQLDPTASFEIGSTGGAPVGSISVDAGATLTVGGISKIAGPLADTGAVALQTGSTLTVTGSLSGSGRVTLNGTSDLVLGAGAAAGGSIGFTAANQTLDISAGGGVGARINGFVAGDTILVSGSVAGVTYTSNLDGTGSLALNNAGGGVIQALTVPDPGTDVYFVLAGANGGPATITRAPTASAPGAGTAAFLNNGTAYIGNGVTVSAAGLAVGTEIVSGPGATLTVAGTLAVQSAGDTANHLLSVGNKAFVQASTLVSGSNGTIAIDPTATLEIGSAGGAAAGVLSVDTGQTVSLNVVNGNVVNSGTIAVGSVTINGNLNGVGHDLVGVGYPFVVNGTIGAGQTLDFQGVFAAAAFYPGSNLAAITGFGTGDVLVLRNAAPIDTATYVTTNGTVGTLILSHDGTTVQTLTLTGSYTGTTFLTHPDRISGTDISMVAGNVACFAEGTRIATTRGDIAVEALQPGDQVQLADGTTAPVVWLGHRRIDCRRHPRRHDVWPVRVRAGAFGPGRPSRDLRLSPDHAVLAPDGGGLIPIRYLINGASIVQERTLDITYFHVELPNHAVLLAENLACESYLDTGNRTAFANAGPATQLHPDFQPAMDIWRQFACAPLVLQGPRLAAARTRLLAHAHDLGHTATDDPGLVLLADGISLTPTIDGTKWQVRLPPTLRRLRLVSRRWVPAEMRGDDTDTRRLGVALGRLRVDGKPVGLNDPRLSSGWLPTEAKWRWTDGDAGIALAGATTLEFYLMAPARYWGREEAKLGRRQAVLF